MTDIHYEFSAGPAVLPASALAEAQAHLVDFAGQGRSLVEMSHRGATVSGMAKEAENNLRELLNIPDTHAVLFMQGGGTGQFSCVPLNLCKADGKATVADYVVTGTWTAKALTEARKYVDARVSVDVKKTTGAFRSIPAQSEWTLSENAKYVYYTDNETVSGTEFSGAPELASGELVCDMSSNFLSRPVDVSKYGIIYAGAQKNCGIAGVTIVIVKKSLLGQHREDTPVCLEYETAAKNNSMYNTPPVFAIYVAGLVFKWIKSEGGVEEMAKRADARAAALYAAIDGSGGFYNAPVSKDARSRMNVVFLIKDGDAELEAKFVAEADKRNLHSLKGHRSVGGLRASLYNAMPMAGVEKLIAFMQEFQSANQ